jgi:hypothetical protein
LAKDRKPSAASVTSVQAGETAVNVKTTSAID